MGRKIFKPLKPRMGRECTKLSRGRMSIKIRFFGRFQEIFGSYIEMEIENNATLESSIKRATEGNQQGYDLIFNEQGLFRQFVIVLQNDSRVDSRSANETVVKSGDNITVFLPISGG